MSQVSESTEKWQGKKERCLWGKREKKNQNIIVNHVDLKYERLFPKYVSHPW